ncbi:unnamed protein product [Ectocarpus sp. 13 AM-2016]
MKRQHSIGARAPISAVSAGGGGGGGGHAFATPQGSVDTAMQDGGSFGQYTPAPNGVQIAAMPWPAASLLPRPPPPRPGPQPHETGTPKTAHPTPPGLDVRTHSTTRPIMFPGRLSRFRQPTPLLLLPRSTPTGQRPNSAKGSRKSSTPWRNELYGGIPRWDTCGPLSSHTKT